MAATTITANRASGSPAEKDELATPTCTATGEHAIPAWRAQGMASTHVAAALAGYQLNVSRLSG